MKKFRTFLTVIIVPILIAGVALSLLSGILRFVVLNPNYYKKNLANKSYCEQMQGYINEDLDHIAILYNLEDGAMENFVSTESIKEYTSRYIDTVFDINNTDGSLVVPKYRNNEFVNYILSNTSYNYDAATDFGDDCAEAVESNLASINQDILLDNVALLLESDLVIQFTALFVMLAGLTLGLMALLIFMYIGSLRQGVIAVFGSVFCGATLIFVPLWVFELKGYTERLNLAPSAGYVQLTGIINTFIGGGVKIAGICLLVSLVILVPLFIFAKKSKKREK